MTRYSRDCMDGMSQNRALGKAQASGISRPHTYIWLKRVQLRLQEAIRRYKKRILRRCSESRDKEAVCSYLHRAW